MKKALIPSEIKVLQAIKQGANYRQAAAKSLKASPDAVMRNLHSLEKRGIICRSGTTKSRGITYCINPQVLLKHATITIDAALGLKEVLA